MQEAKNLIEDVIRQIRGQTVSLYAFSSKLKTVVPSTLDYIFARLAIKDLDINQEDAEETRFASVLDALKQQAFPHTSTKRYTIIMLTDGGDTQLEGLKGSAREQEIQKILSAIPNPRQLNVHLYPIGIGSLKPQMIPNVTFQGNPVLSKLEPEILKELAEEERGVYYMAHQWSSWSLARELMTQIKENVLKDAKENQIERGKVAGVEKEKILLWISIIKCLWD